ncbi:hypothetical protein TRFO_05620 [Tritrichomonas foetus]|uniref:Uncharacterized protein n=1 Tax=Tritrichomonas foetus TaxID=1144522 RepID=A0A1J4K4N6_9EUKA|nr:hypothetical protein TRFO_05620 [Tritrichomonas foetus]|eukprot:OHT06409.1 hypothetical protein TRFO_05620 [Tritrichomonas foetus]
MTQQLIKFTLISITTILHHLVINFIHFFEHFINGSLKLENDIQNESNKINKETGKHSHSELFGALGDSLGSTDFIKKVYEPENLKEEITLDNVMKRIQNKKMNRISYSKEISFLASHFYQLNLSENSSDPNNIIQVMFQIFDINDFEELVSNKHLRIQDEDSLFNFIDLIIQIKGTENLFLFDYIEFQYLNVEKINRFKIYFEQINEQYQIIHPKLFSSLFRRLSIDISRYNTTHQNDRQKFSQSFEIFKYLSNKTGGNIVSNNTISVSHSMKELGTIENLFDLSPNKYLRLRLHNGSCNILIDMKENKINIQKYIFSMPSSQT